MAQFEISRDGGHEEVEAAKRVWRARFSLDVEPAGPVHALISLTGDKTSVRLWAERVGTTSITYRWEVTKDGERAIDGTHTVVRVGADGRPLALADDVRALLETDGSGAGGIRTPGPA